MGIPNSQLGAVFSHFLENIMTQLQSVRRHALEAVSQKRSEKSPDFLGELTEPPWDDGVKPDRFRVAAWWKPIKNGECAGRMFFCLALTPLS
jgi:hypothetical protein